MHRSHIIISGTGRAGTSFLVQILSRLGLDTGYDADSLELLSAARDALMGQVFFETARAGFEMDIRSAAAPYIVKTPFLCDHVEEVLASNIRIDHAILPIRSFEAAAASRAHVQMAATGAKDRVKRTPGGLWDVDTADKQADVLRYKFTKLIEVLVRYDVPITFLAFPRLVRDPEYLYEKLQFLLKDTDVVSFRSAFKSIVRPEWVHKFTSDDN